MHDNILIGLILVIIGLVFAPFTCFTSLLVSFIGIVLILNGNSIFESKKSKSKRICTSCGREIPFDAKLCPYCGNDLGNGKKL